MIFSLTFTIPTHLNWFVPGTPSVQALQKVTMKICQRILTDWHSNMFTICRGYSNSGGSAGHLWTIYYLKKLHNM